MQEKIVIIGGGYAGILTAKKLHKKLKKKVKSGEVEITLIDKKPYQSLLTELHEIAFSRANNESVKIYFDKVFKGYKINVCLDEVTEIDYDNKVIKTKSNTDYQYTKVIQAIGSTPAYFGIEGAKENTLPIWSVTNAQHIHDIIIDRFSEAEMTTDPELRKELLTFVVAGAGFTGIEVVGELEEWISRTLLHKYKTIYREDVRIVIIDGAKDVLSAFGERATKKVRRRLDKCGIEVVLNSFISKVTPDEVFYKDNSESIKTKTVIWTSGITNEPISAEGVATERNRVVVDDTLKAIDKQDVYAIGDVMYFVPEGEQMSVPQMVENCERAAPVLANNIAQSIKGTDKIKHYNPAFHGAMACIGGRYGVAELKVAGLTIVMSSFFAMLVKHMVNMVYFLSAAGFSKIWTYIKDEMFFVEDRRSFIGGHLSASKPSIYLVPLRIYLGIYWIKQGFPKAYRDITGGWEEICDPTDFAYGPEDQWLDVCQQYAKPESSTTETATSTSDAGSSTSDAAASSADATSSSTEAAGATDAAATGSDAATASGDAAASGADAASSASTTEAAPVVEATTSEESKGFFGDLADTLSGVGSTPSDYGLAYDLHLLPKWFTDFLVWAVDLGTGAMSGMTWLMELTFDFAELILGVLLLIGLFTTFASTALTILAVVISLGSFASYGMIVEGLFFSIFSAIAIIGFGSKDYMPLSVDYYLMPLFKKKKKRKVKKD